MRYDPLPPNNESPAGLLAHHLRFWVPPSEPETYIRPARPLYWWEGGRITRIPGNALTGRTELGQHSSATVFTQRPDTNHLLAVNFDAERRSVAHESGGWKVLRFDHIAQDRRSTYSSVNLSGAEPNMLRLDRVNGYLSCRLSTTFRMSLMTVDQHLQ